MVKYQGPILTSCTDIADLGIENTDLKTSPGVELDDTQKLLTCSVLDVSQALE